MFRLRHVYFVKPKANEEGRFGGDHMCMYTVCPALAISLHFSIWLSLSISLSLFLVLCICISISFSIYHLPIYLSIYQRAIMRDFLQTWKVDKHHWKRSKSARRPQKFDVDNIKNAAILRDVLEYPELPTSKTRQFRQTSFKDKTWREDPMA